MKNAVAWLFLVSLAVALGAADPTKPLALTDLPPAAQKAIGQQIGKMPVTKIEQRTEEGEVVYSIDFNRDGHERNLSVAADGTLLTLEITLAETPAAVRKTIDQQLQGATLDGIDKAFDDEEMTYEVDIKRGGIKRSFTVASNGKLVRLQMDLAETPKPVQKTIAAQAGKPGDIFRIVDNGQTSYDVELLKDGRKEEINIAENGHLECVKVSFGDMPAPAQKTVTSRLGNGHIQRIDKCFENNGDIIFEISAKKDGKRFDFLVGARGRFLGMNK
jgi:uncharacterized membrane protein YkoI